MSERRQQPDPERLTARLLGPDEPELSCDQCFAELDRYVELTLAGVDRDQQIPGMRAHLEGCPACAEDYQSLLDFCRSPEAGALWHNAR